MKYKSRWKIKNYEKATKGMSAKEVQQWYNVSQATAYRWLKKAERSNNNVRTIRE